MPIDGFLRFHPTWGDIQTVKPSNPGAGNDFVFTFPSGFVFELQTVRFLFTTVGGGIARQPILCYGNGADIIFEEYADITQAVGTANTYNYQFVTAVTEDHLTGANVHASAPALLLTGPNYNITFTWTNKQAGDTITNIIMNYVQWRIE